MKFGAIQFLRLEWPDAVVLKSRTGEAALTAELGDNYDKYHLFLSELLESLGPDPEATDFKTADEFFEACALRQEIHMAEQVLRNCRSFRKDGLALGCEQPEAIPVADDRGRLISTKTKAARPGIAGHGRSRAAFPEPKPFPTAP